jgi:hypothetical protein
MVAKYQWDPTTATANLSPIIYVKLDDSLVDIDNEAVVQFKEFRHVWNSAVKLLSGVAGDQINESSRIVYISDM